MYCAKQRGDSVLTETQYNSVRHKKGINERVWAEGKSIDPYSTRAAECALRATCACVRAFVSSCGLSFRNERK